MDNSEQIDYWNGVAGERWATYDERMSRLLATIGEDLIAHAPPSPGIRALDIGCGGGSQSQLLANAIGDGGEVMGVDISIPLLEVARTRKIQGGASLAFVEADASVHRFEQESVDLLFSRFGVMFFDDPAAAFTNLRGALRPGGKLLFSCWQSAKDNDWMWKPFQAALKHLPPPPPQPEYAPGPFAFADPERIRSILQTAGFSDVTIAAHAVTLTFGEESSLAANVRESASIGPVSGMLQDVEPPLLDTVMSEIEAAVREHYDGSALQLPGQVWFVTAHST